ncbi:hypothetical protein [Acuticoccus sediminis]|uniref:hypothetical protein n=1 Tax=Acuticoccus sediminis TaxID=2184697 RepID=UPI001CFD54AD|nr:hypothetical protein [Acuticoccus sediminis]
MTNARAIVLAGALVALGIVVQPLVRGAAVTPAVAQNDADLQAFADFLGQQHQQTLTGLEQIYDRLGETNDLLARIADHMAPPPVETEKPRAQRR